MKRYVLRLTADFVIEADDIEHATKVAEHIRAVRDAIAAYRIKKTVETKQWVSIDEEIT